jgi:hypothetical protein
MRNLLLGAAALMLVGCGGGGSGTAAQPETAAPSARRGSSNVIAESEITSQYQNALEVVQNLRPQMLIPRGAGSDASGMSAASIPIIIYMDDVRLGEPSSLVKEIRFLNARDATTRYGTGHGSGVIVVTTKR